MELQVVALAVIAAAIVTGAFALTRWWQSRSDPLNLSLPDVSRDLDLDIEVSAEDMGEARQQAKRRVIGNPENVPRRAITALILLSVALALAGAFMAARGTVETGTSALPILRPMLELTTSVWAYVAALAWVSRRILIHRDRQKAEQAAGVTGYLEESVRRLAYEARDVADGATRVIATSEDEPEEIRERILDALESGEDDTLSLNPEAFEGPSNDGLDAEQEELVEDLEAGESAALALEMELLDASDEYAEQVASDAESDHADPWREEMKLVKLDLASMLDFDELLWRVGLPAAITSGILLLAVELWVSPILYPAIFGAGLLVGVLNYLRVSRKRSRRLESLRRDRERVTFDDLSILVKEVEVPEKTVCYAQFSDAMFQSRTYAHDDRAEFADEIAHRAYELVQGVPVSPSIMEKQATQLENLQPDLHGFRDTERERIMKWLLSRVQDTRHGLIPKAKLIEDCVEYDVSDRRVGPGRRGTGFDPALVRECYRDLVPEALVEQDIEGRGDDGSVTAVRLRSDPLPPEYGEVRAAFTSQFQNYANWSPLYELPDVSDQLDEEPVYADTLGYRAGGL